MSSGGGYKALPSTAGGGESSPSRSITTEVTDIDSIRALTLEDEEGDLVAVTGGAARPPSPLEGEEKRDGGDDRQGEAEGEERHHGEGRGGGHHRHHQRNGKEEEEEGGGCLAGLKHMTHLKRHGDGGHHHHPGRAPKLPNIPVPAHAPGGSIIQPAGANPNLVISGHQDLQTLYATNDSQTGPITVNVVNAPNTSTIQCGCENVNCPFCNLMLSIEKTDPNVLQ